jgi:hypothetical protein
MAGFSSVKCKNISARKIFSEKRNTHAVRCAYSPQFLRFKYNQKNVVSCDAVTRERLYKFCKILYFMFLLGSLLPVLRIYQSEMWR